MKKSIVFIEISMASSNPNLPSSGIEALKVSRSLGFEVIVLASDIDFYSPIKHMVDKWIQCETGNVNSVVSICEELAPKAILTFSDLFVGIANIAANRLGLKSVSNTESPAIIRDKSKVREALDTKGIRNVKWAVSSLDNEIVSSPIGYPCIVKPVDGSASWDVRKIENDNELQNALKSQKERTNYGRGVLPKRKALFEEEIIGEIYSIEGFVDGSNIEVWGYNDRMMVPPPYYYEVGSTFFLEEPNEGIKDYCMEVLKATQYDYGPFHLEFIVSNKGAILVELNPRLIGGGAHQCMNHSFNTSIVEYIIRKYLDMSVEKLSFSSYSTLYDLYPNKEGIITNINFNEVSNISSVKEIQITKKIGDILTHPKSNSDSFGYLITVGDSHEESANNARNAAKLIKIDVEKRRILS